MQQKSGHQNELVEPSAVAGCSRKIGTGPSRWPRCRPWTKVLSRPELGPGWSIGQWRHSLRPLLVFLTNAQTHCHKTSCQSYGNPPVFFQIIKNLIFGLKSLRVDCQCLPFHLKLTEPHSLIGNCQLGQIFKTHFASRTRVFNLTNEQTK